MRLNALNALGTHLLLELRDCNSASLNDLQFVRQTLLDTAKQIGATVIGDSFHEFSPQGVTGVVAIAESHLCIHTWPEYAYAAVDVFTCGEAINPEDAVSPIVRALESRDHSVISLKRGILPALASGVEPGLANIVRTGA
ncbi:MAG: adenosylmethionine decarboxylase [Chloroflexi bacterium]|nr:adenosylmethionine decarboxylase [Chloroflexota bacterium]